MTRSPYTSVPTAQSGANGDGFLVSGTRTRFRKEFTDPTLAAWDVVTGSGMTIDVSNSLLSVTTGTNINSVTSLTTKERFTGPFRAAFGFKISQKIINQAFFVELVAADLENPINDDENVVAAWRISADDSVTTTVARTEVRNGQAARVQSGNLTVGTQTADQIFEIVLESDEVSFHARPMDSTGGKTVSHVRNSVAPDPNREYKLRFRIVNGATAPASSTTFTSAFVTAVDYTEILSELTGAQGRTDASSALAVTVSGTAVTSLANGTLGASSTVTGTSVNKLVTAATTNAAVIKATAARVYGYHYTNNTAATKYVRLYNKATAPTVGTDSPAVVIPIAPNASVLVDHTIPITFATGLGISVTGGFADNDATVTAVGDVVGHLLWI